MSSEIPREQATRERSRERGPGDRAKEHATRSRSREKSRDRVTRERSRERSRERGPRERSRDRSRDRATRRPRSPQRTYVVKEAAEDRLIYSRTTAISKIIKMCTYCGKRHSSSCVLRTHPDANDDTKIDWANSTIGRAILAAGYGKGG